MQSYDRMKMKGNKMNAHVENAGSLVPSEHFDADVLKAAARYIKLQDREVHPDGNFDNAKRWLPSSSEKCSCCAGLRTPSRAFPYGLLIHCRTATHVANQFGVDEIEVLRAAKHLREYISRDF
jgi:hypothetical protein